MLYLCSFLLLVGYVTCSENVKEPRLEISSPAGTFRGKVLTSRSGAQFASYRGIPFALPPTGERRFALPEPFPKIENVVYDATDFGPMCVQHIDSYTLGQEDCLYVNVYTPLKLEDSEDVTLKKVMVYVYGGGLVLGSSNTYIPGDLVTKTDVIVVTFNYRVGWFGFLRGNPDSLPGNQAFHDQVLALKWVKNNILAFGGDPDDVTISGESAGGICVSVLTISPLTKGLFTRAIIMSGAGFHFPTPPQTSTDLLEALSSALGCGNHSDVILCVKQQPAEKIVMNFSPLFYLRLISSGDTVLPHTVPEIINDPDYLNQVGFFNRNYIASLTKDDGYIRVNSQFGKIDTSSLESSISEISRLFYLPKYVVESLLLEYLKSYENIEKAVVAICTDYYYIRNMNYFLDTYGKNPAQEKQQRENHLYFLSFDHKPSYFPGNYAFHGIDLMYLFDVPSSKYFGGFYFTEEGGDFIDEDFDLMDDYSQLIAAFIKTGNPNDYLTNTKNIVWSPYENTNKHYLSFSRQPSLHQDLYGKRRIIWEELVPQWKKEYEILQEKQEL